VRERKQKTVAAATGTRQDYRVPDDPRAAGAALTFCSSFLALQQFVEAKNGPGAYHRLRDVLASRHGLHLPPVIEPGSWLPTQAFVTGMDVAKDLFGPADFHERFGAARADFEIKWVLRIVLKFTSPVWVLERGADMWRQMHNTGTWEIVGHTRWLRGTLRDFAVVNKGYCASLRAWLTRAGQHTGATSLQVVERECRTRGAAACVFEGHW